MWEHDATEQAYKRGYEKGYEAGKRDAVVHAHWVVLDDFHTGKPVFCSNCHEHFILKRSTPTETMRERQKFCFNCGAKMDLED